jgi:hypothetical protein
VTDGKTIDKSYDTTLYRDDFPAHGFYEKDREAYYHLAKAQSHPSHVLKDRLHHMLYVLCYGLDEDNEDNEDNEGNEDGDNPGDIFQHADSAYEIDFPNRELELRDDLSVGQLP